MKLYFVNSCRTYKKEASFDIIYEWEDQFCKSLNASIHYEHSFHRYIHGVPFISWLLKSRRLHFSIDMIPYINRTRYNVIPQIVDFYYKKGSRDYELFEEKYSKFPLVFISSKEVYEYLIENHCKVNILHLGLSISDVYSITPYTQYEKQYNLVLMGRPNPMLAKFLDMYVKDHPDFVYVYRRQVNGEFNYYTSNGQLIGNLDTREGYIDLMRKAKVGFYSTPGIDGGEVRTNGFSQVTPRLLEYIACGCHVIARYRNNSDTDYYELNSICPNIDTYEDFEKRMDYCLNNTVDMEFYSDYLAKHYTSVRAKELREILNHL